jgi:hypothetical protein
MVSIPLLSGITATERADFVQSLPVNLEPVTVESGISQGYLRSAPGCATFATGPGPDRGGVVWNNLMHRVMGTSLVSISQAGVVTVLGEVGGTGPVTLSYGFGKLAVRSGTALYYWDGASLVQVTDPDLGAVLSLVWMDGYYVTTDGESIVVPDLSDPTSVNPLKYGSAEQDPDPIVALFRVRNELYALGANTVQVYTDAGNSGFPFQVNPGATIPVGCINPQAVCAFQQSFAFVGAGRNEAIGVHLAQGGTAQKLSTRIIDDALAATADLSSITLESRVGRDEQRLIVHLPDRSFCYLVSASARSSQPIWYELRSGQGMDRPYRLRNAVYFANRWYVGDTETGAIGVLDEALPTHFGEYAGSRFDTTLIYNKAKGGIVHSLELVGLGGRGDGDPSVFLSFTNDGETYSVERAASSGAKVQRERRLSWRPHRRFSRYMGMRVRSDGTGIQGWAALEADVEALA